MEHQNHARRHAVRLTDLAILTSWIVLVAVGLLSLWRYSADPGAQERAPQTWPTDSPLSHRDGRPTLVMFAHPRCACTRASLQGLVKLLSTRGGELDTHVVFVRPPGAPEGFEHDGLWASTTNVQSVVLHFDIGGVEARRFGATTSGLVLLYDARGDRVFQGGITRARGEEGVSDGMLAVESFLRSGHASLDSAPVYGCPLFDSDAPSIQGRRP